MGFSKTSLWCFAVVSAIAMTRIDAKAALRGQAFVVEELESSIFRQKRQTSTTGIASLKVTSIVRSRFARVSFVSKMENNEDSANEMTFSVRLPKAAFITEFNMVVARVTFIGKVKEKSVAKDQYDQTVTKGNAGGLIAANVRETETFDVSANVPAHSTVEFHLTYQQLLTRKFGEYNHAISVNLRQVIEDFTIYVYITETTGITHVSTTAPGSDASHRGKSYTDSGEVDITTDIRRSKYRAKVSFKPTISEQRKYLLLPEDQQKFTVKYDVTREMLGGEIQIRNGYFVHFFAPEDLPAVSKNVVFVIDRSGSMIGRKISQTKTALKSILRELRRSDRFTIVTFASDVTTWNYGTIGLLDANTINIDNAIEFTERIRATGGTNVNSAILKSTELLNNEKARGDEETASMIILLTDGNPTSGITSTTQIRMNARKAIGGRYSLFCLGFGNDVDQDFLNRLASENDGIARKIYEDSDADLQLEGFYQEVATPLLLNVSMKYFGVKTKDVSKSEFDQFFRGSEAVIVGATEKKDKQLKAKIKGTSKTGAVVYDIVSSKVDDGFQEWYDDAGEFDDFIERLWAYYTIRGFLEKIRLSQSRREVSEISKKALALALKYKFVTSLTSMVVTTPEDEITTTPAGPTIYPPIPPCLPWGSPIARPLTYGPRPPIWCPILLNGARASSATKPRASARSFKSRSGGGAQRSASRSGGARRGRPSSIAGGAGRAMRTYSTGGARRGPSSSVAGGLPRALSYFLNGYRTYSASQPKQPGQPLPTYTTTTRFFRTQSPQPSWSPPTYTITRVVSIKTIPTTTPTTKYPASRPKCGKKLVGTKGRIELPKDVRDYEFRCTWKIDVGGDGFIDLYVEKMNTTTNEVFVTSNGKTLMKHTGGVMLPKTIKVSSNKAKVLMIIKPGDDLWPGVIITYKKVTRESRRPAMVSSAFNLTPFMANCGGNISSEDNPNGVIKSPNYPKLYPDNALCFWKFSNENSARMKLRITFLDIDIEIGKDDQCIHDVLVLQLGKKNKALCGYDLPDMVETEEEEVTIRFLSDDSLGAGGFKLRYEFVKK